MTATGEPDEYVGYIKGYQGESSVDYYVFGADESGHRYTQPVFAELDPHHFQMEAHAPAEPTISVTDITFEVDEPATFTITNNTASAFDVNTISEIEYNYLDFETSEPLPVTLQPGESLDVTVYIAIYAKGYVNTAIEIISSLGIHTITVEINESIIDGVDENDAASFEVYPNPMNNTLYINGDVKDVTIFNAVGQQVLFVENASAIDVAELGEGLYFVRVSDKNGNSVVKKIVKK